MVKWGSWYCFAWCTDGDEDLETAMQLVELYSSKQLVEKSQGGVGGDKDARDKVTIKFLQRPGCVTLLCPSQEMQAASPMEEKW